MDCAVTALPILILLMDKLDVLRRPLGQRILRYASLDDIAIWAVLALILMDWRRVGRQIAFLAAFTGGLGSIDAPSWSPDSKRLAFVSYQRLPSEARIRE